MTGCPCGLTNSGLCLEGRPGVWVRFQRALGYSTPITPRSLQLGSPSPQASTTPRSRSQHPNLTNTDSPRRVTRLCQDYHHQFRSSVSVSEHLPAPSPPTHTQKDLRCDRQYGAHRLTSVPQSPNECIRVTHSKCHERHSSKEEATGESALGRNLGAAAL